MTLDDIMKLTVEGAAAVDPLRRPITVGRAYTFLPKRFLGHKTMGKSQ